MATLSEGPVKMLANLAACRAGWFACVLAVLGGATGGPLSYYGGARLVGVELAPWLLPAEALAWALICLALSRRFGHPLALARRAR